MMQIIAVAIVSVVITMLVKQYRPEYAVVMQLVTGAVLLFLLAGNIKEAVSGIKTIAEASSYPKEYSVIMIKALGLCIVTQLGADTCRDAGETALATKVELAGKITVVVMAMPLFNAALKIIASIIGG